MTSVSVSVTNLWPSILKLLLERQIILDDAVVHHHDVALAIAMRMRVLFGGTAVRGPARVADAVTAVHRILPDGLFQVAQLAGGAAHAERIVIAINRDARRVVAAVFQALQAVQNDRNRLPFADVADDSAHSNIIESRLLIRLEVPGIARFTFLLGDIPQLLLNFAPANLYILRQILPGTLDAGDGSERNRADCAARRRI